jgi:hypothetical protein
MTTLTSVLALREQPRGTYGGYHIKPFRNGRFWHVSIKNERGTHIIYCGRRSEERAVFEAVDTIRKWNRLAAVREKFGN